MEAKSERHAITAGSGTESVTLLGELERARRRVAFDQYAAMVELLRTRVCDRIAAGVPQERWESGVAGEIGLAMGMSPHKAGVMLGRAKVLHRTLPNTLARLRDGDISPEAVIVVVTGLSHLQAHLQSQADELLCGADFAVGTFGLCRLQDLVQRTAYELDRDATLERIAWAEKDRHVHIRPLPDCMARVSVVLPLAKAVGVYAALKRAADSVVGIGTEPRSRAQIMADVAFERVTGQTDGIVPVAVRLVVADTVLLGDGEGSAHLDGGGFVPAEAARSLVARAAGASKAWLKRLYAQPESGSVVGLDSGRRIFPAGLADLIAARDRYCRTPYCDAPIAHTDHVRPHAAGGATALDNGQGLCAACNYAKSAPGWSAHVTRDASGRHTVETRTPTGATHRSVAPKIA